MTNDKLQSPERRSISSQISTMGTRLGRALNLEGGRPDFDRSSTTGTMVNSEDRQGFRQDRSVSRGRERTAPSFGYTRRTSTSQDSDDTESIEVARGRDAYIGQTISTGRGGAGNFMRASSLEPESKGHVYSDKAISRALSTGRGGAGNIRPIPNEGPMTVNSRTGLVSYATARDEDAYEREVMARAAAAREQVHSTGRGGVGNISTSRSRSRSKGPASALYPAGRASGGNNA